MAERIMLSHRDCAIANGSLPDQHHDGKPQLPTPVSAQLLELEFIAFIFPQALVQFKLEVSFRYPRPGHRRCAARLWRIGALPLIRPRLVNFVPRGTATHGCFMTCPKCFMAAGPEVASGRCHE